MLCEILDACEVFRRHSLGVQSRFGSLNIKYVHKVAMFALRDVTVILNLMFIGPCIIVIVEE